MDAKSKGCVGKLNEMLNGEVLPEMSGVHEQCIYKVPQMIRKTNPQAYTPQIISIGSFHSPHGSSDNILHKMEQLKLNYLKGFLNRTNLSVDILVFKVQEWENRIRSCYSEVLNINSNDFVNIIIIDACFILELFLRPLTTEDWIGKYTIYKKYWLFRDIKRDLMLLENQLPFFVLEDIYKLACINLELPPFLAITIGYFDELNLQNINSRSCPTPEHFTDLIRTFLLPRVSSLVLFEQEVIGNTIDNVYSVSQLSEAGLLFEANESNHILDLNFDDSGVLKLPRLQLDDGTELHLRNIIAFEECHISINSRYISQYSKILDFLIKTEKDVNILVEKKIIVNVMSDSNEVATMVKSLRKNTLMPKLNSEYLSVCHRLNRFYENPRNKYKATFVREYFNTPWKIASTLAAILLLLLTLIQTVCSICSL